MTFAGGLICVDVRLGDEHDAELVTLSLEQIVRDVAARVYHDGGPLLLAAD